MQIKLIRSTTSVRLLRLARLGVGSLAVTFLLLTPVRLAAQGGAQVENINWVPASPSGTDNCQRLRDTLAALPASPSQVVRLAPGFFMCGETTLFVPSHVTLQGSGDNTFVYGEIDSAAAGVVHLSGQAILGRLTVRNRNDSPAHGAIAVSAWDLPPLPGSPTLVDVTARVDSTTVPGHPLLVSGEAVRVEGGWFADGDIRLLGGGYTFTLLGGALEGVDADATVTAHCSLFRRLTTDAAVVSGC